jgi:hypothetical protein
VAAGRHRDLRIGLMVTGYFAIIGSVPTVLQPGPHGPLSPDEIDDAVQLMDHLAAEVTADRDIAGGQ